VARAVLDGTASSRLLLRERLNSHIAWWRRAGASKTVQRWITRGVQARMHRRLDPFCRPPMAVDPEDMAWLREKLAEHVVAGAVEEATCLQFIAAAFVVRSGALGKRRLVIDLKDLNEASLVAGIRFEGLPHLRHLLRPDDHLFSIDLESAFHHVPIAPHHRRFFTFSVAGMIFQFAAIPFGWSASPLIFTKVLRPFTKYLRSGGEAAPVLTVPPLTERSPSPGDYELPPLLPRKRPADLSGQSLPTIPAQQQQRSESTPPPLPATFVDDADEAAELTATPETFATSARGLRCLMYLDDLIVMAATEAEALAAAALVRAAVAASGLSVNEGKCHWVPTQRLVHLGVELDTVAGTFKVPPRRADSIRATAHELLQYAATHKRWVPARLLARLLGLAASSAIAVPTARLLSRAAHDVLATLPCDKGGNRRLWRNDVRLDRPALADVRAWAQFAYGHPTNGRPIWAPSSTTRTLHTDASTFAWGAVLDHWGPGRAEARGYFSPAERSLHITAQELLAVMYGVDAFASQLRGQTAAVYIDASSVEFALRRGSSRSPTLMPMVRAAWRRWAELGLSVFIRPVRSKDNPADDPSRFIDTSDWMLNPRTFTDLSRRWGRATIDLFASETNKQLPRFCTRWPTPSAIALDAFAIPWGAEARCWANPPWDLLPRVLSKLRLEGATATVIAPLWRSATWWPDLMELARDVVVFDPAPDAFFPGHLGSATPLGNPRWQFVAVDIAPRLPTLGLLR